MLSDPSFHPLTGICIILFLAFIFVFTIFGYTFELYLSLGARIFFSLILTAVGGLIAALWRRIRLLEAQISSLRECVNQLEQP